MNMLNFIISTIIAIVLSVSFLAGLHLVVTVLRNIASAWTGLLISGRCPYLYYNRVVHAPEFETASSISDGSSGCHDVDRIPEIYRLEKSPESG